MRIYLDLDSRRLFTTSPRFLPELEFKRRDNDPIEIQFTQNGVQELPAGTVVRLGVKPSGNYNAEFFSEVTLTKTGAGTNTVYSGLLNFYTTTLEAAFGGNPAAIPAMLEVQWTTGSVVLSSKTLPVTIHNDVIRGGEGSPTTPPSPFVVNSGGVTAIAVVSSMPATPAADTLYILM